MALNIFYYVFKLYAKKSIYQIYCQIRLLQANKNLIFTTFSQKPCVKFANIMTIKTSFRNRLIISKHKPDSRGEKMQFF